MEFPFLKYHSFQSPLKELPVYYGPDNIPAYFLKELSTELETNLDFDFPIVPTPGNFTRRLESCKCNFHFLKRKSLIGKQLPSGLLNIYM